MPFNKLKTTLPMFCMLAAIFAASNVFGQSKTGIDLIIDQKTNRSKALVYSNAKLSAKIADSVIQLSRLHNKPLAEAGGWNIKGVIMSFISNPDSALAYFNKTEQIGLRIKDKLTIAKAKQNKNLPLSRMGKYDQAMGTCLEALKLYQELGLRDAQASCLADIGNILIRQNRSLDAIKYLNEAIGIADDLNNESIKPNFYNSIAVAYKETEQYALAKSTYLKALPLAEKFNRVNNQISILMNLGELSWQVNRKGSESIPYYLQAEKLTISYGDDSKLAAIYQNLGNIYNVEGAHQTAMEYAIKARDLAIKSKDVESQERIFNSLAAYSSSAGNYKEAYQAGLMRDSIYRIMFDAKATENMNELQTKYETVKKQTRIDLLAKQNQIQNLQISEKNLLLENNELELMKNKLQINNQELTLRAQKEQLIKEQLESKTRKQQLQLLDSENKLQKLQLMERNIIIGVTVGIFILVVLIGLLIYNRYKLRQEGKLQAERIRQQENAASAVINAEESERNRIAGELHDGLGQLFSAVKMNLSGISDHLDFKDQHSREIFEKTLDMVDESCREVRVISHQMAPNVLLKAGLSAAIRDFISKIDARKLKINLETFGLQERLSQNTEAVLYRVVQESVNNVIKHSGASSLDIQITKDEEGINAMIEDNGKGFNAGDTETFAGMGMKNIKSRVNYLKGAVDFSSEPGKGTLVAIHIPL